MPNQISISPSPELLRFAQRRVRMQKLVPLTDRRDEPRENYVTPVLLQPVNSDLEVVGKPIHAVTRDISQSGLGLIVERMPLHKLFAVHFSVEGEESCLLASLKWSQFDGPFDYVGLRALAVLEVPADVELPAGTVDISYRFAGSLAP